MRSPLFIAQSPSSSSPNLIGRSRPRLAPFFMPSPSGLVVTGPSVYKGWGWLLNSGTGWASCTRPSASFGINSYRKSMLISQTIAFYHS